MCAIFEGNGNKNVFIICFVAIQILKFVTSLGNMAYFIWGFINDDLMV